MSRKVVVIVGMPGAGKTEAADFFVEKGFQYVRMGQVTMDELEQRNMEVSEENEKAVREKLRKKHGMAAFAKLNLPKIEELLENDNVVVDGLYSWAEYKEFKKRFGKDMKTVAIYSSPNTRYRRLAARSLPDDKDSRMRPLTNEDAKKRDHAEIENLEKGGPIAMADVTMINEGSLDELKENVDRIIDGLPEE